ncbi:sugar ABC transporter permease [Paenibacillus chitinolyticus]|uniref:carbohydrate ABC transporter permease n=1 Tax=Paenibacillus chitinolyticus TaxID=79263 RepID=UPI0026E4FA9C|nr:carbohydrate ABC transporter permease [Paenibacillus chitinolyticus]GKS15062.1 sugar ABC transporter permease [Paenibacillus chitinolyticus]
MVEKQKRLKKLILVMLAYGGSLLTLFPFLWMLATSFKTNKEVFSSGLSIIPKTFSLANYTKALEVAPILTYLSNSIIVSVTTTVGVVITSLLAGYALSRLHFPGRNIIFIAVLGTMMVPHQSSMIPSFIMLKNFGWLDSFKALIIPFLVYPFAIFMMRNFLLNLPKELEEAAYLDGCTRLQILYKIFLPLSKPAIASVVIMNFTHVWNDFFWPLVMTKSVNMRTMQVGLSMLKNEFTLQWPLLMSATVISAIPIFIIYICFQRFFVQGAVSSGVKG